MGDSGRVFKGVWMVLAVSGCVWLTLDVVGWNQLTVDDIGCLWLPIYTCMPVKGV